MKTTIKEVPVSFTRHYKQVEHTCPVCGDAFQGSTMAVYCSDVCRRKAAWQRNGGKIVERRKRERREKREA